MYCSFHKVTDFKNCKKILIQHSNHWNIYIFSFNNKASLYSNLKNNIWFITTYYFVCYVWLSSCHHICILFLHFSAIKSSPEAVKSLIQMFWFTRCRNEWHYEIHWRSLKETLKVYKNFNLLPRLAKYTRQNLCVAMHFVTEAGGRNARKQ